MRQATHRRYQAESPHSNGTRSHSPNSMHTPNSPVASSVYNTPGTPSSVVSHGADGMQGDSPTTQHASSLYSLRRRHENEHQHVLDEMQHHLEMSRSAAVSNSPGRVLRRGTRTDTSTTLQGAAADPAGTSLSFLSPNLQFSSLFTISLFTFLLGRFGLSISWYLLFILALWMSLKKLQNTPFWDKVSVGNVLWLMWSFVAPLIGMGGSTTKGGITPRVRSRSPSLSVTNFHNFRTNRPLRRNLLDESMYQTGQVAAETAHRIANQFNSSFINGDNSDLSQSHFVTTPRLSEGTLPFNFIIAALWSTWDNASMQAALNDLITSYKEQFSTFIEQIEITFVDMDTSPRGAPIITEVRCIDATLERTVFELDINYSGDFKTEWFMRPKVLPLNLRCMVKDVVMEATVRLEIEYVHDGGLVGSLGEVNISFAEYPAVLEGSVQMFESLDFQSLAGSIPAVTGIVKRKFEDAISMFVYPNTYVIYEDPAKQGDHHKRDNLPLHFGIESRNISEMEDLGLEDEIKNTLLDINNLLKTRLAQGSNTDAVKREVTQSVLQFLRYGTEPGRIPVSMMEMIKRGFQILNRLAFDDQKQGEICEPVFEEIMKPENFELIGEVARGGSLADDLLSNIMKLKNKELQTRVNSTLRDLNMQDIVWSVLSRGEQR